MAGRACNCSRPCSACGCWGAARCRRFMSCLIPAGSCSSCLRRPSPLQDHAATTLVAAHNSPSRPPSSDIHESHVVATPLPLISPPGFPHGIRAAETHPPVSSPSSTQVHAVPGPDIGPDLVVLGQELPDLTVEQLEVLIHLVEKEIDRLDPESAGSSSQAPISQRLGKMLDKYEEFKQICVSFVQSLPKELKKKVTENGRSVVMPLLSQALGGMGEVHWLGVGFTFIAWSLDNINDTINNRKDCMRILRRSLRLLEHAKTIWQLTNNGDAFRKEGLLQVSVETAVRSAIFCTSKMTEHFILRAVQASTMKEAIGALEAELDRAVYDIMMHTQKYQLQSKVERQVTFRALPNQTGGQREVIEDAVTFLTAADALRAVLLYGMGGIGKSTLAMHIFSHFQKGSINGTSYRACRVELPLDTRPEHFNLSDVQRQIIEKLCQYEAPKFSNFTDGQQQLEKDLQQISQYPVFLYVDNVLEHTDLTKLLPEASSASPSCFPHGSKLLITSRSSRTDGFSTLGIPKVSFKAIKVEKLQGEEAKQLLWKNLGSEAGKHRSNGEIASLEDRVLSYCDGMPLALKVVGRYISATESDNNLENVEVWRGVEESMQKAESLDGGEIAEIHSCLQFSIQNLNKSVKQAFLDVVFALNVRWFGYKKIDTLGRLVGSQKYMNDLCQRCLVQKVEETGTIEMHDVFRALGKRMVEEDKEALRISKERELTKCVHDGTLQKVVALHGVTVQATQLQQMSKLRFLSEVSVVGECEIIKLSQLRMADGLYCSRSGVFDWSVCAFLKHVSWGRLFASSSEEMPSPSDVSNLEVLSKLSFCL